jgi:hypothetical protein
VRRTAPSDPDGRQSTAHPQTIHVTVFAEWDTLYGRALSETFAALASHGLAAPLDDPTNYPALLEELEKGLLAHRPPVTVAAAGGKIQVTVIPYLRGLDGASSLYRASYGEVSEGSTPKNLQDQNSGSHRSNLIEAAEGTTQFDYIRRLTRESFTHNVPFWPQIERPDAVVVFGTDIYDKLVLLEFLRQQLRNCLYLTTDLDALYWHPHYLRFTRGLIVASAFPLEMSATLCGPTEGSNAICTPVEFRDSYQSAAYLVVTRCLQQSNRSLSGGTFAFNPDSFLYRIGNTKPLLVLANSPGSRLGEAHKSAFETFVGGVEGWVGGLLEPIMEGTSSFWPFVIQMTAIGVGLYSLFFDVTLRMQLSLEAAEVLWSAALALVPSSLRPELAEFRTQRLRPRWQKLPLRRQPWQAAPTKTIRRAPFSGEQTIERRTLAIREHYSPLLDGATTKVEVAEIASCLLSDLFSLRSLSQPQAAKPLQRSWRFRGLADIWTHLRRGDRSRETEAPECNCQLVYAVEVRPFAKYFHRDLTSPNQFSKEAYPDQKSFLGRWILKCWHFGARRLPHSGFLGVGLATLFMLLAICLQPVPFLVGPGTLSYGWRVVFWFINVGALLVTFSLFHRTCYEQYRFRMLVQELQALVTNPNLGISNRQLVLVLSKSSEPVANLTIVPCAMLFLIYASHLNPLGGVPMAGELALLLGLLLVTMLYSYTHLRRAAIAARSAVLEAYRKEITDAARLKARLQSYADGTQPLQDDEDSLVHELELLIAASSTTPTDVCQRIAKNIKEKAFRHGLREYLESLIQRDKTFVQQIGEIRGGVLGPLLTNPITAALMIPIGGASGLSVVEWIVSNAR